MKDKFFKFEHNGILTEAEKDMEIIFQLAIVETFKPYDKTSMTLLNNYASLMEKKDEIIKGLEGK